MITPPVRQRLVGGALRRFRQNLGLNLDDAARILECDRSKISRIETGQRGIRPKELRELLTEYGVEKETQDVLASISLPKGVTGWWRAYTDLLSGTRQDFLALEAAASQIAVWETHRIPDLLQTRDYARALADIDPSLTSDMARDAFTEMLMARQRALLSGKHPEITAIITETALQMAVGGPRVMHEQLARLTEVANDSGLVSIHVLLAAYGVQGAVTGPMTILRFSEVPGIGVVHLPGPQGGHSIDEGADIAAYSRAFEQLKAYALGPGKSAILLRRLAER